MTKSTPVATISMPSIRQTANNDPVCSGGSFSGFFGSVGVGAVGAMVGGTVGAVVTAEVVGFVGSSWVACTKLPGVSVVLRFSETVSIPF